MYVGLWSNFVILFWVLDLKKCLMQKICVKAQNKFHCLLEFKFFAEVTKYSAHKRNSGLLRSCSQMQLKKKKEIAVFETQIQKHRNTEKLRWLHSKVQK